MGNPLAPDVVRVPREPDDAWAERFCAAVNWMPDGNESKIVEGRWHHVTFRELAKGYIRAMLAAAPVPETPAKQLTEKQIEEVRFDYLHTSDEERINALCDMALAASRGIPDTEARDSARYRAWRDGDVIVRRDNHGEGWEVKNRDDPHWDVGSWFWSESLDAAIDAALASVPVNAQTQAEAK